MTRRDDLPLSGARAGERSRIMAGPTCGPMLPDLGAEVIEIEKFPGGGDARGDAKPDDPGLNPPARIAKDPSSASTDRSVGRLVGHLPDASGGLFSSGGK